MGGRRSASALLFAVALAVTLVAMPVGQARASRSQVSIFQDDSRLDADPAGMLARLRMLGVQVVRVSVSWKSIAPAPNARHAPRGFNASDPAAYPAANWRIWDAIVAAAHRYGIKVDFDLMGGAPRWALGPGRPARSRNPNWAPSELAPRGQIRWGIFSGMTPLGFLRALYCVDSSYHELRGLAARIRGCPTTAVGSRRFRAENPALFAATGVSDHPYMRWYTPNHEADPDPTNHLSTGDYTSLGVIGNLTRALDRLVGVYGTYRRFPVYDTEFGYITSPPKHSPDPSGGSTVFYVPPATAAANLDWAEYISWRNPRLASLDKYLLYDPFRPTRANDWGGFASGVLSWNGAPKATYNAWRLPLYLPVAAARPGHPLEVWGCVRPAPFAALDTGEPQTAEIEFAPGVSAGYTRIGTVAISPGGSCYFDRRIRFGSSGTVQLMYTYPSGIRVFSRAVVVTVR